MITGTDQGIFAEAGGSDGSFVLEQIDVSGRAAGPVQYAVDPRLLCEVAASGSFDSYSAGTAAVLLERFPGLGLELHILRRTLPLRKGLSSSAAICVLTARAFNIVHGLGLSVEEEMDLAYRGELLAGSACGRMDQACAFGGVPVVLEMDGDSLGVRKLHPAAELHMLIVDLRAGKDTRRILADLNSAFLAGERGIRDALGPSNRRILSLASEAVESGDLPALGAAMKEAQGIFDRQVAPCCPSQLTAPVLHRVLACPAASEYAHGGKGVGSQGDGTAQFLCRDATSRVLLAEELERSFGVSCLDLTIAASQ